MPEPQSTVKTQHPRDYTVQIRAAGTDQIVGTGVAVDARRVATCAHVVEEATGVAPCHGSDLRVDVYYPQAAGGSGEKTRAAGLQACFKGCDDEGYDIGYDDDVVLLALEESAPIGPEQHVGLGYAERSAGHTFRAYGYKQLGKYRAGYASGTVMGCVECPLNLQLQADPVELDSPHLAEGMSGAGVLDMERNLVVGLVSEVYYAPDDKNRNVGWAVDAKVLTFDPLNLPLADRPRPKEKVALPPLPDRRLGLLCPAEPQALHGAPPPLEEWVGRDDLLAALTRDWQDPGTTITALVGFGGEGKSSLARQWVAEAPHEGPLAALTAVFWWSFYDDPSAEAFFEALLDFLSGGQIGPRDVPSISAQMKLAARLLRGGRYVLVLDGFEVMQHQEGDDYGLVRSTDLRVFLEYLAVPPDGRAPPDGMGPESDEPGRAGTFTLMTSRSPLIDLLPYTTATQRDVTRLSAADGRALLRALGVKGPDSDLDRVVREWDGHALTLSLLGGLLVEQHDGDVRHIDDLPKPTEDENRYERVHRVLRRYDEHLSEAERAFLKRFSAFRIPVGREAMERVCTAANQQAEASDSPTSEAVLPIPAALPSLLKHLIAYRLLRHDPRADTYSTHPLIRNHYLALFTQGDEDEIRAAHERIKEVYLELAGDTLPFPTLNDLRPLVEAVHHACRAGAYDEAHLIHWQRICQRSRYVLGNQLGAYEVALELVYEFFPRANGNPDLMAAPQVSDPVNRRWILHEAAFCLKNLGRLREAVTVFNRHVRKCVEAKEWHSGSISCQNLVQLQIYFGDLLPGSGQGLKAAMKTCRRARELGRRADNQQDEIASLCWLAWVEHLRGQTPSALKHFAQAETLESEIDRRKHYLYSMRGVLHADALRIAARCDVPLSIGSTSLVQYARHIIEADIRICELSQWPDDLSRCHRALADLIAFASPCEDVAPRIHYDKALRIARSINKCDVLIEALIARGRYLARDRPGVGDLEDPRGLEDLDQALADLREALELATRGGYRIYEADTRVALAWAHLASGDPDRARAEVLRRAQDEAERALAMSEEMGYHWGQVDAEEVLKELKDTV